MSLRCVSSVYVCWVGSAIACVCRWVVCEFCAHVRLVRAHIQSARAPSPPRVSEEGGEKNPSLVISNYFCWVIAWRVSSLRASPPVFASISSPLPCSPLPCLDGWWPMIVQMDVIVPLWRWPDWGLPVQHIWESGKWYWWKVRADPGFKKTGGGWMGGFFLPLHLLQMTSWYCSLASCCILPFYQVMTAAEMLLPLCRYKSITNHPPKAKAYR